VDIQPIRNAQDHDAAMAEIDRLWGSKAGTPEGDKLSVLMTLVAAYEDKNFPPSPPAPIEGIEYYMDKLGLTRKDLEPHMGGRSHVSEILNRKRPLSLAMIRALGREFGIPAEVLIQEYALEGEEAGDAVISTESGGVAWVYGHVIRAAPKVRAYATLSYTVPMHEGVILQASPGHQDTQVAPMEICEYDRPHLDSPVHARCH